MSTPTVSVIVPCRSEADLIRVCLHSILTQEPPPGGLEIIVADGMSDDGTRGILNQLAAEHTRLQVVANPGLIVSTGLNAALRVARGRIIVRMDAHTEYAEDYVRQCVAVLQETGADNVGGPALTKSTGYVQSAICAAYHSPFAVGGARFHDVEYEGYVDTVPYGCWPRAVFERFGFFDEELIRNQDDEFNLRLTRAGGKIWQSPRIKSWYYPRRSLVALFWQYMQYGYWKVRIIRKHFLPASVRHLVPATFLLTMLVLGVSAPFWPLALQAWLVFGGLYMACNLAASVIAACKGGISLLPILPLVFSSYHFGYAFGFLLGVWDFLILRRGPTKKMSIITRPTEKGLQRP